MNTLYCITDMFMFEILFENFLIDRLIKLFNKNKNEKMKNKKIVYTENKCILYS